MKNENDWNNIILYCVFSHFVYENIVIYVNNSTYLKEKEWRSHWKNNSLKINVEKDLFVEVPL